MKTMLRFHLTPVRMAVIKNTDNKSWRGCREKGTLTHCCWDCSTTTMENSMAAPQKLKIDLPYDPAIPLLGHTERI
jgi:hypothetical protein